MRFVDLALWLLVGLLLIGWVWLFTRQSAVEAPRRRRESEPCVSTVVDPIRSGNEVLTSPPIIRTTRFGDVTLRDWLTRFHPKRDGVWSEVVTEFYTRAAGDLQIASYFAHVDLAKLQRHFLAALLIVTGRGLTTRAVESLREKHATVRDLNGNPITGEIYDRVVTTLGEVIAETLVEADVMPGPVLDQLLATIGPLRDAIVWPRAGQM